MIEKRGDLTFYVDEKGEEYIYIPSLIARLQATEKIYEEKARDKTLDPLTRVSYKAVVVMSRLQEIVLGGSKYGMDAGDKLDAEFPNFIEDLARGRK